MTEHFERMQRAAESLRLAFPLDETTARSYVASLAEAVGLTEARIRINLLMRDGDSSDVLITADEAPPFHELGPAEAVGPCDARFRGSLAIGGLKTMNYMSNRLAHREGATRGFDEVLFMSEDGGVLEGSRSTVFMVSDGVLTTPSTSTGILPGVTRGVVLSLARAMNIPMETGSFSLQQLARCDEAFLTGSVAGVRPISRVEKSVLAANPGPITRTLAHEYKASVESNS
jgi:branched-subunit amino acid aminotransferase/4-amino-4-deoxychorismate lyase